MCPRELIVCSMCGESMLRMHVKKHEEANVMRHIRLLSTFISEKTQKVVHITII